MTEWYGGREHAPQRKKYICPKCRTEITFDRVLELDAFRDDDTFRMMFECDCRAGYVVKHMTREFLVDREAMKRLLNGLVVRLPYRAADRPAGKLNDRLETQLAIFAWECEQLQDVEEFLLFCSRRPMSS